MHYFISDAHIRTDESYRSKLLVQFLREIKRKMTHLYILGDLFEFWFEYNIVFPKNYFKTLAVLYNLIQDGKEIHYIFVFIVHNNHALLTINGKRVYLAHGNKIDKRLWITLWEKMLTSKMNHALYSLIHPDVGVFLAQGISYLSRRQQGNPNLVYLLEQYAQRKLKEVDIVMLAHSHIPVLKKFHGDKYYINTGDWVKHFSYAVIDGGRVVLRTYR
jgi:UDP-2,3-diacylglucosamine hydrolase